MKQILRIISIALVMVLPFKNAFAGDWSEYTLRQGDKVFQLIIETESEGRQYLTVFQTYPPLKQEPARYEMVKEGESPMNFAFGVLRMPQDSYFLGNSYLLGILVQWRVVLSKADKLQVCNAEKSCFIFQRHWIN